LYVTTNMTLGYDGIIAIKPNQCARGSLNKLGVDEHTRGHWYHRLQGNIANIIPLWLLQFVVVRKTR